MDVEQVTRYFERLYNPGQHFEIAAVKDGRARRKTFEWPTESETVLSALDTFEKQNFNIYASVLPVEQQETGFYDRVWIDRDDPDAPWPFGSDEKWEYTQWPEPTTVVRTSQGEAGGIRWQAIWRLDETIPEDKAREVIKNLAKRGSGDPSVHDPRRVLRIPGLMNAKRQNVARLLASRGGYTSLDSFDMDMSAHDQGVTIDKLLNMDLVRPHEVLGEWLAGVYEGDRARKAYVTARFLKSCGVSFDDALVIVATGARRSEPVLSDQEVTHSVQSAYHKD